MPAKILRPRQIKFKNDIREAFIKRFRRILAIAPCGFGKTPTLVEIVLDALKKGKKILFIVHRVEIINHCSDDLLECGLEHGIIFTPIKHKENTKRKRKNPIPNSKFNLSLPVQLSSWQTLKNKSADIFIPDLIIYDEAHRSVAEGPMKVLARYPNAKLIGFTATPYRSDGQGLGQLYDCLVESCQISDLIKEELLVNPEYYVCSNLEAEKVLTENLTELEASEIEAEIIIKADIVRNFKNICGNEQCCVFCPTVERAEEVAKKFEAAGFKTGVIEATTPKKKREQLLKDFSEKKFQIILNASLLSEGWNYPELGCVILLRNLNSRMFWKQAIGRVMRTHPNKKKAYVLDFFNCIDKFGLIEDDEKYSLEGKVQRYKSSKPEDIFKNQYTVCINCAEIYLRSNLKCSVCGVVNERDEKIIVEQIKNLEKINKETFKISKNDKQEEFSKLCEQAINKNYAPGWVNNKYRNKFGVWPKGLERTQEYRDYCEQYEANKQQEKENIMDLFGKMEYSSGDRLRTVKG